VARPPLLFQLGWARWPCLALVVGVVALLAGVPLASLVWRTGLEGSPPVWSAASVGQQLEKACRVHGTLVAGSEGLAAAAGGVAAAHGLVVCWLALDKRWFQRGALGLMAAVWALPGPVLCFGLLATIQIVLGVSDSVLSNQLLVHLTPAELRKAIHHQVAVALYYGPSPLPVLWVYVLRFLPCAIAVLWPVVRLTPIELREAIRIDGARPNQELRLLILPLATPACARAALAVMVLSLGELSASKPLETPGSQTFAHKLWEQLHYSTTAEVTALCLVLLGTVLMSELAWAVVTWIIRRPLARKRPPWKM
jgi:ABC-type Fe3+ transport system permease subunit